MSKLYRMADYRRNAKLVHFTRSELNRILNLYGRNVAAGEWRDYAIDQRPGCAVFAIFRSSHEDPIYTIAKRAVGGCGHRFTVVAGERKLREGATIDEVLTAFAPPLRLITESKLTPR